MNCDIPHILLKNLNIEKKSVVQTQILPLGLVNGQFSFILKVIAQNWTFAEQKFALSCVCKTDTAHVDNTF